MLINNFLEIFGEKTIEFYDDSTELCKDTESPLGSLMTVEESDEMEHASKDRSGCDHERPL